MAITGTHALFHCSQPDELRALLRDAFGWDHVDAHDGWLIFKLPPAELGVHPGQVASHEISVMCDDIHETMAELSARGVRFEGEPEDRGFGVGVTMRLP